MYEFLLIKNDGPVGVITLNRPRVLNAWHAPMRKELISALNGYADDKSVGAIVLTGAGDRAFCAGQDLNETRVFDGNRGSDWIREWEALYDTIRSLSKPLIAALNGLAAGSAFQVALLADLRVGHSDVRMGQPEINSGIASTTGPWIMKEILGLARTIDLTLTGRLMDATECVAVGLINRLVPRDRVLPDAVTLATELSRKPPLAMRLNKRRFKEMTEQSFRDAIEAGIRVQRESFSSGEPARMMERFLTKQNTPKPGSA